MPHFLFNISNLNTPAHNTEHAFPDKHCIQIHLYTFILIYDLFIVLQNKLGHIGGYTDIHTFHLSISEIINKFLTLLKRAIL